MILGADLLVQMILMGFAAPGLWKTLIPPFYYHNILIIPFSFCCRFTEIFWPFWFSVFMHCKQQSRCSMACCSHAIYIYFLSIYLLVVKLFSIRFPICLSSVKRRLVLESFCVKKTWLLFFYGDSTETGNCWLLVFPMWTSRPRL